MTASPNKIILDRFGILPAYIRLVKYHETDEFVQMLRSGPMLDRENLGIFENANKSK